MTVGFLNFCGVLLVIYTSAGHGKGSQDCRFSPTSIAVTDKANIGDVVAELRCTQSCKNIVLSLSSDTKFFRLEDDNSLVLNELLHNVQPSQLTSVTVIQTKNTKHAECTVSVELVTSVIGIGDSTFAEAENLDGITTAPVDGSSPAGDSGMTSDADVTRGADVISDTGTTSRADATSDSGATSDSNATIDSGATSDSNATIDSGETTSPSSVYAATDGAVRSSITAHTVEGMTAEGTTNSLPSDITRQAILTAQENLKELRQTSVISEVIMSGLRKLRSTMLPRERNLTADEITSTSEVFLGTISELLEKDLSTATHGTGVSPDNVAQELEYFQECLLEAGDYFRPLQVTTNNTITVAQSFRSSISFRIEVKSSQNASSSVVFPSRYIVGTSSVDVAVTQYKGSFMNPTVRNNQSLVSDIISVVTLPAAPKHLEQPVELTFKRQETDEEDKQMFHCTFWNFNTSTWRGDGCEVYSLNSTHVRCHCYHLTNFAILMQVVHVEISGDVYRGLETLTVIGSSVSLTAIGLTLIILIWLRYFSDRLLIMINLMIALGLAQTIFLTGVNATYNKVLCRTVAVLLHYLYMCVFSLMLAEGIQLFQKLYNAMSDGLRVGHLLIAAWTVPAIPVAISVAIRTEDYGTKSSCWLSMKHGTIWAFVGPALLVIFINTVILGLVLKVYLTVRINAKKTQLAKIRSSIKAAVVLLPLIGLTWLFGVMTISSSTVVFQYFFALLNSLQGFFIFIFHVALNNDVKESLKKKKEKLSRSRAWFSSSGSTSKVYFAKQNAVTPILVSSADGNPATTSAHA